MTTGYRKKCKNVKNAVEMKNFSSKVCVEEMRKGGKQKKKSFFFTMFFGLFVFYFISGEFVHPVPRPLAFPWATETPNWQRPQRTHTLRNGGGVGEWRRSEQQKFCGRKLAGNRFSCRFIYLSSNALNIC